MQEYYMDEADETLSLSDLQTEGGDAAVSGEIVTGNKSSSSSSSSSSSASFDEDFFGFFSEEWSSNASPENIIFCGKVISSKLPPPAKGKKSEKSPMLRSNSDSFRFMRTKMAGTSRSKSLPTRLASGSKSRWQVFVMGFGSGKFPGTMELGDIKSRQLRRQGTTTTLTTGWFDGGSHKEVGGGRKSGNKGWWRLVDVLGCGGGYDKETMVIN